MRYVLKRRPGAATRGASPAQLPGITLVDQTNEDVLLVEAEPEALERHRGALEGWTATPEATYPLPGLQRPRPR
jgi:hypothetical protein